MLTLKQERVLSDLEEFLAPGYVLPHIDFSHSLDHIKRMCRLAQMTWREDSGCDPFLLQVAIWFHNLDRSSHRYFDFFKADPRYDYKEAVIQTWCGLHPDTFTEKDVGLIVDAVQRHSKLNDVDGPDTPLLVHLKDCDRLDRLGPIGIANIIQYSTAHRHPLYVIPDDFEGDYESTRESDLRTVMQNLQRTREWVDMLRIPTARELAAKRVPFFDLYVENVERELRELKML